MQNKWSNDPFWCKQQVFDLTEKSLSYLIGWTGQVSCNKLQEIEQCSKPEDRSLHATFSWDMLQAVVASRYTLEELLLLQIA